MAKATLLPPIIQRMNIKISAGRARRWRVARAYRCEAVLDVEIPLGSMTALCLFGFWHFNSLDTAAPALKIDHGADDQHRSNRNNRHKRRQRLRRD
jgi:hypothetical protein